MINSVRTSLRYHALRSTERMKIRYNIILSYASFLLWIWIGIELAETELKGTITQIPWWGFLASATLTYRLECKKRMQKKQSDLEAEQSTTNRPNEA